MANSKLTRNSGRARRRPSASAVSRSDTGEKVAVSRLKSIPPAIGREYAEQIARLLLKLERLCRVTTTVFLALKFQNAERGWDVACTLQFSVVDPIFSIEEDAWQIVAALGREAAGEDMP